jgi:hypothetical protein
MSATKAVFVLIHGGWHNHSAWDRVTRILKANGFAALTLDLPGAGVNAIAPTSLGLRPFDPAAFAAERSPIAGVTQEERTQAVVALVKEVRRSATQGHPGRALGRRDDDFGGRRAGSEPASRGRISCRVHGAERHAGVRIRACGVATSLRRIEHRHRSPIGNYAWKIWHGAAPLHPLHTGSRDSVDRSGSHDCDG